MTVSDKSWREEDGRLIREQEIKRGRERKRERERKMERERERNYIRV